MHNKQTGGVTGSYYLLARTRIRKVLTFESYGYMLATHHHCRDRSSSVTISSGTTKHMEDLAVSRRDN